MLDNGVIIDKFLECDDLNDEVDLILRKHKINKDLYKSIIRHNLSGKPKEKRNRFRKNLTQNKVLYEYYKKNPNWDKAIIERLARELKLK